jgi:hypothetical protein
MTKRLTDLTSSDLLSGQVWEHWTKDNVEYVKPTDKTEITEVSNIGHIVLTEFTLNNMTKYFGFCSPQDTSGLDYIQPVIFTDNGQVAFYKDNEWTEDEKDKALEKFRLNWQAVFPVDYVTKIKCDNKLHSGRILDFNNGDRTKVA